MAVSRRRKETTLQYFVYNLKEHSNKKIIHEPRESRSQATSSSIERRLFRSTEEKSFLASQPSSFLILVASLCFVVGNFGEKYFNWRIYSWYRLVHFLVGIFKRHFASLMVKKKRRNGTKGISFLKPVGWEQEISFIFISCTGPSRDDISTCHASKDVKKHIQGFSKAVRRLAERIKKYHHSGHTNRRCLWVC